jgi:peptidoglycan hydrolase-like protein with peptidoglycan-binding domain
MRRTRFNQLGSRQSRFSPGQVITALALGIATAGGAGIASSVDAAAPTSAPRAGGGCEAYRDNNQYPLTHCDKGEAVRVIQYGLLNRVDPTLEADGYLGLRTEEAVRVYQHQQGLPVTGAVDFATWSVLAWPYAYGADSNANGVVDPWELGTIPPLPEPQPQPPACPSYRSDYAYPIERCGRGEAIRFAQVALRDRVWVAPELEADGYFGPATEAAVRRFQQANGLVVDGVIGQTTWYVLTYGWVVGNDENANGFVDPWEAINLAPWCQV